MRLTAVLVTLLLVSGCTALMLGGGSSGSGAASSQDGSDARIAAQVRSSLAADASVAAFDIGVRSIAGNVTLNGRVDNYRAREQAGRLAKATDGVRTVTNQIVVEH